jgi:dihydrodipicolinate synthetase family protein
MIPTITIPWLAGYIPDLPTPFDEAGRVDVSALARLCERQIAAGVSAIVVCETAGEASTLSPAEHEFVIRAAVDIARGRVRVIAGAGSNSTEQAIQLTRRAEAAGADAILSVVPYSNKPMQSGIHAHPFQLLSAACFAAGGPFMPFLQQRPPCTIDPRFWWPLFPCCQNGREGNGDNESFEKVQGDDRR